MFTPLVQLFNSFILTSCSPAQQANLFKNLPVETTGVIFKKLSWRALDHFHSTCHTYRLLVEAHERFLFLPLAKSFFRQMLAHEVGLFGITMDEKSIALSGIINDEVHPSTLSLYPIPFAESDGDFCIQKNIYILSGPLNAIKSFAFSKISDPRICPNFAILSAEFTLFSPKTAFCYQDHLRKCA